MAICRPDNYGAMNGAKFNALPPNEEYDGLPLVGVGGRRTLTRYGEALAGPSPPTLWGQRNKYHAKQVFTAVTWTPFGGPSGQAFPARMNVDNGSGQSVVNLAFDQTVAKIPFSEGLIYIAGYNEGLATDAWYVTLIAASGASTQFHPQKGSFSLVLAMVGQAIIDLNAGDYPSVPGAIQAPRHDKSYVKTLKFKVK